MVCYRHPDREAVALCVECSNAVCPECRVTYNGRTLCNACVERKIRLAPDIAQNTQLVNTSGMGSNTPVPPGLGSFNWGGFLLTWIWGLGNGVWWSLLALIPYLGWMVMPWVLGFKGNEWAWQSKHWDSIEHFKRVQHIWSVWGWVISIAATAILVVFMIAGTVALLALLQQYSGGH